MNSVRTRLRRRLVRVVAVAVLPAASLAFCSAPLTAQASRPAEPSGCQLNSAGGTIKHVIQLQFDNVHFRRDNPNVPSDIEQMPNLYNFLLGNGTVLNNHHTPLISHTGTDILTTLTGVYPDRHGQPVSNTFMFYGGDGIAHTALSFAYWTDLAQAFDGTAEGKYNLVDAQGNNPPAPWVPYTRAGCNFGAVGTANIELERIANVATVYGPGSPEAIQAADTSDNGQAKTTADFIGVAVHCAKDASLCAAANRGVADALPAEPGGYSGFNGLFGHKYVAPQIGSGGVVRDIEGNAIAGFPGFSAMTAARTLGYTAAMLEHGVPVTFAYLTDAHEDLTTGIELGPGDPIYEANLRSYDHAFADFFARLTRDGITQANTLFVIGADENDHFVGAPPLNPGCDGVSTPCHYDPNKLGQIEVDVQFLLAQQGITTPFDVRDDSAPNFYLVGDPREPSDPDTRLLERALGRLEVTNPLTGRTERITQGMADRTEMKLLHMVTADESRTPTFTIFANPDYHVQAGAPDCSADPPETPVCEFSGGDVWSHGDLAPDINTTWFSFAGPGVRHLGRTDRIWSDHPDVRPTFLTLLGLRDSYSHQGRVLMEILGENALPRALRSHRESLLRLGQLYKQINAPVGALGLASVKLSTRGLESGSAASDQLFARTERSLSALIASRDSLARDIESLLEGAEFAGTRPDEDRVADLIDRAELLLEEVTVSAQDR